MDSEDYVCCNCIGDRYLRKEIVNAGLIKSCSYCDGDQAEVIEFNELADRVGAIYREFYDVGDDGVSFDDDGRPCPIVQGDEPSYIVCEIIMAETIDISDDIVDKLSGEEGDEVRKGCGSPMFDSGLYYARINVVEYEHEGKWELFSEIIKHGSRFFSSESKEILEDIFEGIGSFKSPSGKKVIRKIKGKEVFRARKVKTNQDMEAIYKAPREELSSPPAKLVANGRLNPQGISVFYGAMDKGTCLAELRLAVGEKAVCGKFQISSSTKVIDFTTLTKAFHNLSFFDPQYREKFDRFEFLNGFEKIISKPFSPEDTNLEYLPIQAMTEYLSTELGVEAIIFSSAQRGGKGKNIAILKPKIKVGSKKGNLIFEKGSLSLHEIKSVKYQHSEDDLEQYLRSE